MTNQLAKFSRKMAEIEINPPNVGDNLWSADEIERFREYFGIYAVGFSAEPKPNMSTRQKLLNNIGYRIYAPRRE